jgi:hypothetical protein
MNEYTYADKDLVDVTDPNEPSEEAYLLHIGKPEIPEHKEGATMYCSMQKQRIRCRQSGYVKAHLELFRDKKVSEPDVPSKQVKLSVDQFWKSLSNPEMGISKAKARHILKLDIGIPDWEMRVLTGTEIGRVY